MSEPQDVWEAVYSMDDWYDGPRAGMADYHGVPHYYRSVYLDTPKWDPDEDRFELTPLSVAGSAAALELQAIWQRWCEALAAGTAPEDSHAERALPADKARRDSLEEELFSARSANAHAAFTVHGELELGCRRVRWRPILDAG